MKSLVLFTLVALSLAAQAPPGAAPGAPAGPARGGARGRGGAPVDPIAAARGKDFFGPNCSFCHGADTRGGETGPDLAKSLVIADDAAGKGLTDFLKTGRPDKGMPAFAGVTEAQAADIIAFVRSNMLQTRLPPEAMLKGNAQAGQVYFAGEGKCSTCHSISGDLKGIGAKYDPMTLQGKIVWPRSGGGRGAAAAPDKNPVTVMVTTPTGEKLSGVLVSSDDFVVILRDVSGAQRSVTRTDKTKVEMKDPLQAHFDNLRRLTDKQMHDLTAYLVTIK